MERGSNNHHFQTNDSWEDFDYSDSNLKNTLNNEDVTPGSPSRMEPSLRTAFLKEINTPGYLEYEYSRKVARSERWANELKNDISQYKVALADTTAFNIKEKLLISKRCDDSSLKLFKIKKLLELNQKILASKNPEEIKQKKQEIADFEFPIDISGSDEMIKAEIQAKLNTYEREKIKLNEFLKSFRPENLNPSARPSKIEYFQTLAILKDLETDLFELESEQMARFANTTNQTHERFATLTDKELAAIDTSASYLPIAKEIPEEKIEKPVKLAKPAAPTVSAGEIPDFLSHTVAPKAASRPTIEKNINGKFPTVEKNSQKSGKIIELFKKITRSIAKPFRKAA